MSMAVTRLLIVDDSEEIRLVLASLFRNAGYLVEACEDGQHALMAFEHGTFDLLLTDVEMPLMDGRALVRSLRERGIDIPVVVMTGLIDAGGVGHEIGATASLQKPFRLGAVVATVKRILSATQTGLTS
jgi:CheY-like chemotaxis protein